MAHIIQGISIAFLFNKPIHCLANVRLETINWPPLIIPMIAATCIFQACKIHWTGFVPTATEMCIVGSINWYRNTNSLVHHWHWIELPSENVNSQDEMKGFIILTTLLFSIYILVSYIEMFSFNDSNTCCIACGIPHSFQIYTLHERNREININYIQTIVEEHYERYMDQEEEYEREHGNESDWFRHN